MKKFAIILGIIGISLISLGVSKSFAFDIVSSPTSIQNGTSWETQYGSGSFSIGTATYVRNKINILSNTGLVLNSSSFSATNGNAFSNAGYFPYGSIYGNIGSFTIYNNRYILIVNDYDSGDGFVKSKAILFYDSFTKAIIPLYSCYSEWSSICNGSIPGSKIVQFSKVSVFISESYIHISNGTNVYFYSFSGTLLQTISDPSVNFQSNFKVFPVYLKGLNNTNFFAYQGTDNKSYKVIDTFASGQDLPITSAGTGSVVPLGKFTYNDLILARQTAGSGSLYVKNADTATPSWETSTGYVLTSFNVFQNPLAYFTTSIGTVVKWDMNCDTAGYDSCILNGGVYKCANSIGTLSPGGELCGGTVYTGIPPTCEDGIKNQGETSIDWGGECGTNSCFDGVLNQDEITTDYGGVCGNSSFSSGSLTCKNTTTFSAPTLSTNEYDFGLLPGLEEYQSISGSEWTFDFYSGSSNDEDYFRAFGLGSGTTIFSGSLKSLDSGVVSTMYSSDPSNQYKMGVEIFSNRTTGGKRNIGYVAFWSKKNSGWVGPVWFKNTKTGKMQERQFYDVGTGGNKISYVAEGFEADEVIVYLGDGVKIAGFELGGTGGVSQTTTSCENSEWSCATNLSGNTCSSQFYYGNARGTCGFVAGACVPTQTLEEADWSYSDAPIDTIPQVNADISMEEDIFACEETGFAVLICPFTILGKIWSKFKDFMKVIANFIRAITTIASPTGTGDIIGFILPTAYAEDIGKNLVSPWSVTSTGAMKPDSAPLYDGEDIAGFNFSILTAGDNLKNSAENGGIKGLFAMAQWALIVLLFTSFIVLFVLAIKGKL